jgi:nucleolar protein 15
MYQLGGLQTALELMRHAESAVDIQLHGARSISGLISGELAFFGRDAPQIVSGSALETLAVTLRTFPLDVRVVRAAARAVWVCIHLGGQFGQHTFVQQQVYEPLMFAMNCHLGDLKVVESCCGAVLAAASANPDTQQKLADSGVRDVVRDTLQTISEVSFSGAFTDLSDWLFEA